MEDDHVDRPGVEERQRLKLTGTNSSIGLIVLIPYAHREIRWMAQQRPANSPRGNPTALLPMSLYAPSLKSFSNYVRFVDLVVMAERLHPIPFRTRP